MIFLVQFGINKHLLIYSKTTNCTHPTGLCNFVSLTHAYLFQLNSKSCDYLYKELINVVLECTYPEFCMAKIMCQDLVKGCCSALVVQRLNKSLSGGQHSIFANPYSLKSNLSVGQCLLPSPLYNWSQVFQHSLLYYFG